jgi:hypothetical protein
MIEYETPLFRNGQEISQDQYIRISDFTLVKRWNLGPLTILQKEGDRFSYFLKIPAITGSEVQVPKDIALIMVKAIEQELLKDNVSKLSDAGRLHKQPKKSMYNLRSMCIINFILLNILVFLAGASFVVYLIK